MRPHDGQMVRDGNSIVFAARIQAGSYQHHHIAKLDTLSAPGLARQVNALRCPQRRQRHRGEVRAKGQDAVAVVEHQAGAEALADVAL
jgi:hypothetical protein